MTMHQDSHHTPHAPQDSCKFFRPKPDGEIDPAGEAGWYLQREREKRGESLVFAGDVSGIHPNHLEAIENGRLANLPPRAEALAMISQYARYLGFDAQPLVLHYARFLPRPVAVAPLSASQRPRAFSSAKILSFPLAGKLSRFTSGAGGIVASVAAAVLLFGGLAYTFMPGTPDPAHVAASPPASGDLVASITRVSEGPVPGATSPLGTSADKAADSLGGLTELIQTGKISNSPVAIPRPQNKPARTAAPRKVSEVGASTTGATGRIYGTENKNPRLVLTAKANVWIRIEDRDGNVVVTRTLMAGDSYRVPDRKGLVVIARDGGRLIYRLDGRPGIKLGNDGEILVGRSIDPADLLSGRS